MQFLNSILNKKYFPLIVFATAMGFLEAIVVVYLRALYYPDGFNFPLITMPEWIIVVELTRELCTLFMLCTVAWISGKTFLQRLSVFLFVFGVWDILYYVALKLFLDWPESLLTWDILFLIPITWVGPVLAPVICSVVMIIMTLIFDYLIQYKNLNTLKAIELLIIFVGAAFIYYTFTVDFGMIILRENFLKDFFNLADNPDFLKILSSWEPETYNWWFFWVGIITILFSMFLIVKRGLKSEP